MNTNEEGVLQNKSNGFDNGRSFLVAGSYYDDLDIFGESSLYHLLNRTTTKHGAAELAALLSIGTISKEKIEDYQAAVRILSTQTDIRQLLTANGLLYVDEKTTLHSITNWLEVHSRINHQAWWKIVRWILPLYNFPAFIYMLATGDWQFVLIGASVSYLLTGIYFRYIKEQHELIGKKQEILDQYAAILNIYKSINTGNSKELKKLHHETSEAIQAIKQLSRLTAFFDQRLNLLVAVFFNSLFLYDLQCLSALEQWKEKYKNKFEGWIHCVGEIECLNSIAAFAFNNPGYTYPVVSNGSL
ncbi:MAG: hypothetical protein ABUT20_45095, partial [Bacteroidota bacterium]